MLFFIRARLREQPPLPREQWLGMVAATWEVISQLERNGKARAAGALIGQGGGVAIVDVDSNDELSDILTRLPVYAFLEWEVAPMTAAERALDSARWAMAALARPVGAAS